MSARIFFLHIPKTAGSSFNEMFKPCVPADRFYTHMESRPDEIGGVLSSQSDFFLSGHLSLKQFSHVFAKNDIFCVTVLRNPADQFISHINWLKYVGSPQYPNPGAVPENILRLANSLYSTKLSDIASIERIIDVPIGRILLDNLQTRYLSDPHVQNVTQIQLNDARQNIKLFDLVLKTENLENGVKALKQHFSNIAPLSRLNQARINEKPELSDEDFREFVHRWNKFDLQLYRSLE